MEKVEVCRDMEPNDLLYDAILKGDAKAAVALAQAAIEAGSDAGEMVTRRMIAAMDEVGRRFEAGEFFV